MSSIQQLFHGLDGGTALTTIAPQLASPLAVDEPALALPLAPLRSDGLVALEGAEPAPSCARLAAAIGALVDAGAPATFVYVDDAPWALGERIGRAISAAIGRRYVLVVDFWAFHVAPGRTGWAPHRGIAKLLDRDAPEFFDVWVALTDAGVERSCMHYVPLGSDPGYPDDLDRTTPPLDRAVPVTAGTAVMWNANVLHWGGACSPAAAGPRVSLTYCVCREDAAAGLGFTPVDALSLDREARLDLIASQIVLYGADQPDVSDAARKWASARQLLRSAGALLRKER